MADFGDNSGDDYGGLTSDQKIDFIGAEDQYGYHMTPEQKREYDRKRKRDAALGLLSWLGSTVALGAVGGAVSGAGNAVPVAATTGTSSATAIPTVTAASTTLPSTAPGAAGAMNLGGAGVASGGNMAPAAASSGGGFMSKVASGAKKMGKASWLGAAGEAIGSILNLRSNSKDRETRERLERDRLAQELAIEQMRDQRDRDLQAQELALEESKLDPYRQLLAQLVALEKADRLANTQPLEVDFSNSRPGAFAPTVRGGAQNWRPSAETTLAANNAKQAVATGTGANRGVISEQKVRDLLNLGGQPAPEPRSTTMPVRDRMAPNTGGVTRMPDIDNLSAREEEMDPLAPTFVARRPLPLRRRRMVATA